MKVEQNIYLKMGRSGRQGCTNHSLLWIVNGPEAFNDVFALVSEGLNT